MKENPWLKQENLEYVPCNFNNLPGTGIQKVELEYTEIQLWRDYT